MLVSLLLHHVLDVLLQHDVHFLPWVVERIDHVVRHAAYSVVDVPVLGLVGPDGLHDIIDRALLPQGPIPLGNLGCLLVLPLCKFAPLRCVLHLAEYPGVGVARLLLDVPDEAVASRRIDHVRGQEEGPKSKLCPNHCHLERRPGLLHPDERQEVHARVVGLLKEHVEHAAVTGHVAQQAEVLLWMVGQKREMGGKQGRVRKNPNTKCEGGERKGSRE